MEQHVFERVIDECGPYLYTVELHSWGEPLANPAFFQMVRYARRQNIQVITSSTLSTFSGAMCRDLVSSGLNVLIVSLHGASQDSAARYQQGISFNDTIERVQAVRAEKHRLGVQHPSVVWRLLPTRYNEHEIPTARQVFASMGFDALETPIYFRCNMGQELLFDQYQQFEDVQPWLPRNEALSQYSYAARRRKRAPQTCKWLWCRSAINWDGSVSPCDAVWHQKYDFGNIQDQPFFRIWNGPLYQAARRMMRGVQTDDPTLICAICKRNHAILEW
jgi:radical SAM protein with 4Fe4S-binding SPASM domain